MFVVMIVDQCDAALKIFLNLLVHLCHCAALIVHDGVLLGTFHIRNARSIGIFTIGLCPNVDQHEVEIGAQQEGFAIQGFYARSFGIVCQQLQCFIGLRYTFVARFPVVERSVKVVLLIIFPKIHGFIEARVHTIGAQPHIVRTGFEECKITRLRIGSSEQFCNLVFIVDAYIEVAIGLFAQKVSTTHTGNEPQDTEQKGASLENVGEFGKNVGHFWKNVGVFWKNVGDFLRNLGDFV